MLRAVKVRKKKNWLKTFPRVALTLVQIQMSNSRDGAWHSVGPPRLSAFIIVASPFAHYHGLSNHYCLVPDDLMTRDIDGEIGRPLNLPRSSF